MQFDSLYVLSSSCLKGATYTVVVVLAFNYGFYVKSYWLCVLSGFVFCLRGRDSRFKVYCSVGGSRY